MSAHQKDTVILYHGDCPDGFGGAFSAWKKYGDSAEYIPLSHGRPAPTGFDGRDLYFIDFCYPKEIMDQFVATARSVTVLDHHLGVRAVVESMPHFVFDEKRSGATIAWNYFHPDIPTPVLLQYVQEGDLYTFKLPDSRAILAYCYAQKFDFASWDKLLAELEDEKTRAQTLQIGKIYGEHFAILLNQVAHKVMLVSFEGYECYLATAIGMFASDVGNLLARAKPPLGIVVNFYGDGLNVSLRSDSSVDVSALARKYGGNGHPRASGFRIKWGDPFPWRVIEEHANFSD